MKPSSEIKDSVRSIRARNGKTSPPKSMYINPTTSSERGPDLKQMSTDAPSVVEPDGYPGYWAATSVPNTASMPLASR